MPELDAERWDDVVYVFEPDKIKPLVMQEPTFDSDLPDLPRYSIPEAARYLSMSASTLRSWASGRKYPVSDGIRDWEPVFQRPDPDNPQLSYSNLMEAYVLLALRTQYRVNMSEIRYAIDRTKEEEGIDRFLLSEHLVAAPGAVFLQKLSPARNGSENVELINVGMGGQVAMPEILAGYLSRIRWDEAGLPKRLFPVTRTYTHHGPQLVTIDPEVAFGRPVIERKWIRTVTIAERFKAGESVVDLKEDYELEVDEIEEAIRYEQPFDLLAA